MASSFLGGISFREVEVGREIKGLFVGGGSGISRLGYGDVKSQGLTNSSIFEAGSLELKSAVGTIV